MSLKSQPLIYDDGLYADIGYSDVITEKKAYRIRCLTDSDRQRHSEYQRLRAEIFVNRLNWSLPVDEEGRECDRYDRSQSPLISTHCIYDHQEQLLGGVRIFELRQWTDSMIFNEFHLQGMVPQSVLHLLEERYQATDVLEVTRICVTRNPNKQHAIIRDYIYAMVYSLAEKLQRRYTLGIVHRAYYLGFKRSKFVMDELYTQFDQSSRVAGYALVMIDMPRTILAMYDANVHLQDAAKRMLSLCKQKSWIFKS